MNNMIVLGKGYIGEFIYEKFKNVLFTKRTPISNIDIKFDLNLKETWNNLPSVDHVLWTFPASQNFNDISLALDFFDFYCKNQKIIILSTTSGYINKIPDEVITEDSQLDFSIPRIQAEEKLRIKGACILHLAGIFGPGRLPINWYKDQRIQNPNNFVNLIHVYDIIACIENIFNNFHPSKRYNLSNGLFKRHNEILNELKENNLIEKNFTLIQKSNIDICKKISNYKVKHEIMGDNYKFIDYP